MTRIHTTSTDSTAINVRGYGSVEVRWCGGPSSLTATAPLFVLSYTEWVKERWLAKSAPVVTLTFAIGMQALFAVLR